MRFLGIEGKQTENRLLTDWKFKENSVISKFYASISSFMKRMTMKFDIFDGVETTEKKTVKCFNNSK